MPKEMKIPFETVSDQLIPKEIMIPFETVIAEFKPNEMKFEPVKGWVMPRKRKIPIETANLAPKIMTPVCDKNRIQFMLKYFFLDIFMLGSVQYNTVIFGFFGNFLCLRCFFLIFYYK